MAIDFRPRDFLQPAAIARMRWLFERAQWWPLERRRAYEGERLRAVLRHAEARVPFYRDAFKAAGLRPETVRDLADLRRLPTLTKRSVLEDPGRLVAADARRFSPVTVTSTGSTGPPLTVQVDRRTNALEFAFYWRHWSWFGYRLGDRFAQLSWAPFREAPDQDVLTERGTGRLLLNVSAVTARRARAWAAAMVLHRARFLKGHPSALLHFALFVRAERLDLPPLRAIFATGEVLEPCARRLIAEVFGATVADAYGSMERVVAACECPSGRMHANADYGGWDTIDAGPDPTSGRPRGRVVGTGYYTFAMPLVRFELGDLVEAAPDGPCPCGRTLPTVGRIQGRSVDAVTTADGRLLTAAAVVFTGVPGILRGQLVQESLTGLRARVLGSAAFGAGESRRLVEQIRAMVGAGMSIDVERVDGPDAFGPADQKHRAVVSHVTAGAVARGMPLP